MAHEEPADLPVPPRPDGQPDELADAAMPAADVVAAPSIGLPVPPGAPADYRGYGVSDAEPEAPEPIVPPAPEPEPEPQLEPAPEPQPKPAPDPEGRTDSETLAAPGPSEPDPQDWVLRLPDGRGLDVDRMLLIGRHPDPTKGPPGARIVVLDDPARTVSRTHLVIGPSGPGELLVRNLSAVNALVVTSEDGTEFKVQPGGSVVLVESVRILVGAYPVALEAV